MYIMVGMNAQGVGVEFFGPFDCQDKAERYGLLHWQDREGYFWEVVSLTSPS